MIRETKRGGNVKKNEGENLSTLCAYTDAKANILLHTTTSKQNSPQPCTPRITFKSQEYPEETNYFVIAILNFLPLFTTNKNVILFDTS